MLGAVPAWVVVAVDISGPSVGLVLVTALQAVTYLLCAVAVVGLHVAGNHHRLLVGGLLVGGRGRGARSRAGRRPLRSGPIDAVRAWGVTADAGGRALVTTAVVVVPTLAALGWRLATVPLSG